VRRDVLMVTETIKVEVAGVEIRDVYEDLSSVDVELDTELAGMFRLRLPLLLQGDGAWRHLDDERWQPWKQVVISVGLDGPAEPLLSGLVTHVQPTFAPDRKDCVLEVWGLDRSLLMDRVDRLADWPNKKDSDIASEIFARHGFSSHIDDTEIVHDEAVSTIIQRETDWQLLRRLARRNGFSCYVEGNTGHFRAPELGRHPVAVLAAHFGDETNVDRISLDFNALTAADVALHQLDRRSKQVHSTTVEANALRPLGAATSGAWPGAEPGLVVLNRTAATGVAEMAGVARAVHEQHEWLVTGDADISANQLGVVLRPLDTVTVKGVGATFSGVYLITHVTHAFSAEGYVQRVEVTRNGVGTTGAEDFAGTAGSLGGLG